MVRKRRSLADCRIDMELFAESEKVLKQVVKYFWRGVHRAVDVAKIQNLPEGWIT